MKKLLLGLLLCSLACVGVGNDSWIPVFRKILLVDAAQTYYILDHPAERVELNPLYSHQKPLIGEGLCVATGYVAERLVTGIKDKKLRAAVGWLLVGIEAFTVARNVERGVPLLSFGFSW